MDHLIFRAKYSGLMSNDEILSVFHGACEVSGAHIRRSVEYPFYPVGFSAVVILSESHASLHTWPEKGMIMVDYFSCSDNPMYNCFLEHFEKNGFSVKDYSIIERGLGLEENDKKS